MHHIGIVGGGAAAACMVEALSAQPDLSPSELTIFEPSEKLWTGRPFGADLDSVLVNSRAEDMSVRRGDSLHFRCWLNKQSIKDDYVPRSVYGRYLAECANEGIRELIDRGWIVNVVHRAVHESFRVGGNLMLCTSGELYGPFTTLILAAGGNAPQRVHDSDTANRFIADPYPLQDTLRPIKPEETVGILGTGLAAVDAVLALQHVGHSGRIVMTSRSGLLPAVRDRSFDYTPHYLSVDQDVIGSLKAPLSDTQLVQLVRDELSVSGLTLAEIEAEISSAIHDPARERLLRQLDASSGETITALGILQRTIPACGPKLWPLLKDSLRQTFLEEYQRIFLSLCCPMPQRNARKILAMFNSEQLSVQPGLISAKQTEDTVLIRTTGGCVRGDYVINATSAPSDKIPRRASRLIWSLVEEGLATRHPLGGLCVRPDSSLCNGLRIGPASNHNPRVYAIGDLAAGTFYFTFGISSIVDRCKDVSENISYSTRPAPSRSRREINV